jgi:demethylmenaquinone methyltransferase/2-methoxy-6-polyprenyl-1,4-benzoquinol methylase
MFDAIAARYDVVNRVISLGIDARWRRRLVAALALPGSPTRVLDVATGTADVALAIAGIHPHSRIDGVDPSAGMLAIAARKVSARGLSTRVSLRQGQAEALPFGDRTFDGVTMAFGLRNVVPRQRALAEATRVTRPGGRVAILELAEPGRGLFGALGRWHIHWLVPRLGALLSGAREYRYLAESIARFPPAAEVTRMMASAGLEEISATPLTFGVCRLYVGRRPR